MALHFENDFAEGFFSDFFELGEDAGLEEDLGEAAFELRVDEARLDQHLLRGFFVVFDRRRFERRHDGVSAGGGRGGGGRRRKKRRRKKEEGENWIKQKKMYTVKPRYTGPKSNGNLPITNVKLRSFQVISFYCQYWLYLMAQIFFSFFKGFNQSF